MFKQILSCVTFIICVTCLLFFSTCEDRWSVVDEEKWSDESEVFSPQSHLPVLSVSTGGVKYCRKRNTWRAHMFFLRTAIRCCPVI